MKKFLLTYFISLYMIPMSVFAAATAPTESVWFAPKDAAAGDTITLEAFIYNSSQSEATMLVKFESDGKITLGQKTLVVPAVSARTASLQWKMPETDTVVTATVASAIDNKKAELKELLGPIGSITVGAHVAAAANTTPAFTEKISMWWHIFYQTTEEFRTQQATYFAQKRAAAKEVLAPPSTQTVGELPPTTLNPTPTETTSTTSSSALHLPDTFEHFSGYFAYWGYQLLALFFGSAIFFYAGCCLILFLVFRLLYRLFV